ncbi:G-type lectin S-receptor-like serine/threonine-protein kinase At4g27290 [Cornus florida]|uniref:G-type lectin S-receptor-like serine/threonine-protein kinase At4g27290 n=1 Tax=Cornus florida TaxID=4283 RepID=UPI002897959B|nr:G-type lectin S-receptor-like serine/threonine-protein kinase At4g27290 [Cornus florida]
MWADPDDSVNGLGVHPWRPGLLTSRLSKWAEWPGSAVYMEARLCLSLFRTGFSQFGLDTDWAFVGSSGKMYRTGPWNGVRLRPSPVSIPSYTANADEVYFMYKSTNDSYITRLMLNEMGMPQRLILSEGSSEWVAMYTTSNDPCDEYGHCGGNGICRVNNRPVCDCLMWFGNLVDIRYFDDKDNKQDIYIRMPASEFSAETQNQDIELPSFDLLTIADVTNNFPSTNMIGKGGFGPIYKVK